VNNAAINMGVQEDLLYPLYYIHSDVLDYMVGLFLVFGGNSILLSTVVVLLYIPNNSVQQFIFPPHPHQHLLLLVFLMITILARVK
jgi:hypothetical protein